MKKRSTNPRKHEAILKGRRLDLNQLLSQHFGTNSKNNKNNLKTK